MKVNKDRIKRQSDIKFVLDLKAKGYSKEEIFSKFLDRYKNKEILPWWNNTSVRIVFASIIEVLFA